MADSPSTRRPVKPLCSSQDHPRSFSVFAAQVRDPSDRKEWVSGDLPSLDKEKNATLTEKEQVARRIQTIKSTIATLQAELSSPTPQHSAATSKLATISTNILQLFHHIYSLGPSLALLLPQKIGLESNLQKSREAIMQVVTAWGDLCLSLEQALAPTVPNDKDLSPIQAEAQPKVGDWVPSPKSYTSLKRSCNRCSQ